MDGVHFPDTFRRIMHRAAESGGLRHRQMRKLVVGPSDTVDKVANAPFAGFFG